MFPAHQRAIRQNVLKGAQQPTRHLEPRPAQFWSRSLRRVLRTSQPTVQTERGSSLPHPLQGRPWDRRPHPVAVCPTRHSVPLGRSSDHNVNLSLSFPWPFVKKTCSNISPRIVASPIAPTMVGPPTFAPTVPLLTRPSNRYLCDVEADQGECILGGRY